MPTEKELLALCLRWIQHPQGDAFDKAMLIEAIKAKLKPEREWVGLEQSDMPDGEDPMYDDPRFIAGIVWAANKLKEKNDR